MIQMGAVHFVAQEDVVRAGRVLFQLGHVETQVVHSIGHDNGIGHRTVQVLLLLLWSSSLRHY